MFGSQLAARITTTVLQSTSINFSRLSTPVNFCQLWSTWTVGLRLQVNWRLSLECSGLRQFSKTQLRSEHLKMEQCRQQWLRIWLISISWYFHGGPFDSKACCCPPCFYSENSGYLCHNCHNFHDCQECQENDFHECLVSCPIRWSLYWPSALWVDHLVGGGNP